MSLEINSLKNNSAAMRTAIEAELHAVLDLVVDPFDPGLYHMLAYHLGWEGEGAGTAAQGKRIRPLIVLLAADAVRGDWKPALPAAAAVELLHNFSLIHDDIQDQSELRRGRPTVWTRWGVAQAINAGDLMYTLAYTSMLRLDCPGEAEISLRGVNILQKACIQLTQGQYLDLSYEKREDLSLEAYWPMIGGKTAALLAACAELGGLTGGADEHVRRNLWAFGWNLGLAFQAQDDWLGVWGDVAQTGKSTMSDLASRKKTLPVLYAIEKSKRFAEQWRQAPNDDDDLHQLSELMIAEGAQSYTEEKTGELTQTALTALRTAVGVETGAQLEELALRLLGRNS